MGVKLAAQLVVRLARKLATSTVRTAIASIALISTVRTTVASIALISTTMIIVVIDDDHRLKAVDQDRLL